jgi:hypothetical protein
MTVSPTVAYIIGNGHRLLMPIVGLSNSPSGFALTHVILKSYVTVAASRPRKWSRSSINNVWKSDREIAIVLADGIESSCEGCYKVSYNMRNFEDSG